MFQGRRRKHTQHHDRCRATAEDKVAGSGAKLHFAYLPA